MMRKHSFRSRNDNKKEYDSDTRKSFSCNVSIQKAWMLHDNKEWASG